MNIRNPFPTLMVLLNLAVTSAIGQNIGTSVYKFSKEIFENLKKDTTDWRFQQAAYGLSFIGQYNQALQQWDIEEESDITISKTDSLNFVQNYRPVDAKSFILQKAKENQILIFNEAHYNPRNRVFVTSLLKDFKSLGYNYFAAETFTNDSAFFTLKHPTFQTGYFTRESAFGNLVREAINLNFMLYPYEVKTHDLPVEPKEREIKEARNLASLLKQHPDAKIIIYCGFGHIREDTLLNLGKAMAGRLMEYTGINPYTIDQVNLSEHSRIDIESPYYRIINSDKYSILINSKNDPFHTHGVDASLYSPGTTFIYNRPNWVFENGKIPYFIPSKEINLQYPIMVKAYFDTDDRESSIPIDVIEMDKPEEVSKTAISLPKQGHFIIMASDKRGKTETIRISNN